MKRNSHCSGLSESHAHMLVDHTHIQQNSVLQYSIASLIFIRDGSYGARVYLQVSTNYIYTELHVGTTGIS